MASNCVLENGCNFMNELKVLKETHQQFRVPFLFKKKEYQNYVRTEMNEIRKLLSVFRERSGDDSESNKEEEETEEEQSDQT